VSLFICEYKYHSDETISSNYVRPLYSYPMFSQSQNEKSSLLKEIQVFLVIALN